MPQSMPREVGNDYSASAVKYLFEELYGQAHNHPVRSSLPTGQEGSIGDLIIVDDGTSVYICTKTSRGWFKTSALTVI